MKNKFILGVVVFITVALFTTQKLIAQVTSDSNRDWIGVTSYNGSTTYNVFRYSVILSGVNINYPNWSLAVRVNSTITNSEGKIMDPSKIRIRLNNISGDRAPSIPQIGASQTPIPLSFSNQNIIQRSNFPLYHGPTDYYDMYVFGFDIIIEGGIYLEQLKSNLNQYAMGLTFSVLDSSNNLLTQSSPIIMMRIYPEGNPPSEPTYGIIVNTAARNGLLELKTMRDYIEGVSQTYKDGLSVTSTTDYSIEVRSLKNNFEAGNNTVPVNAVSLELKDSRNNGGGTIVLSENTQTVFNTTATGKQARLFDIRYFTTPNDERLINATPASYQTTLMYTLVPR